METKAFKVELKANPDKREIEGYAALFGVEDHGGDVIVKGAFEHTLNEDFAPPGAGRNNRVKVLWQHQKLEPIGRPTDLAEDSRGLHFRARLTPGVARADETLALVADDVIDQMSFGYDTIDSEMGDSPKEDGGGESRRVRYLKTLGLWEISPVTWGMNDATSVGMAKALELAPILQKLGEGQEVTSAELKPLVEVITTQENALAELRGKLEASIQGQKDPEEAPEGAKGETGGFQRLNNILEDFHKWTTEKRK